MLRLEHMLCLSCGEMNLAIVDAGSLRLKSSVAGRMIHSAATCSGCGRVEVTLRDPNGRWFRAADGLATVTQLP